MEQQRTVSTPQGPLNYTLVKKRVKNLNLRIRRDGQVVLSAPLGCTAARAEQLILEKSAWIFQGLRSQTELSDDLPPEPSREACFTMLKAALDRVWPLAAPLGVAYPELRLRRMKSQWGNCHWRQGYITLNTALGRCPEHLRDYVALHELVHFLHQDHGSGFYAVMDALMPDWRARRQELKRYMGAVKG